VREKTEGWRKLHSEEFHDFYSLSELNHCAQIMEDKMHRAGSAHEMRNTYKVLVTKPEGKRPLGKPRH
jgi:hypothetical protein